MEAANRAKQTGLTLLVVAVGNWVNRNEIKSIVSEPAEFNVFNASDFDDLQNVKDALIEAVCNGMFDGQLLLGYLDDSSSM